MGDAIGGRFVAEQLAAVGGLGAVYRAHDQNTGRPVAIKLALRNDAPALMARFEREAAALAALDHPHIVRYIDHGVDERGRFYLAMEWLEGEDLAVRLRRGPLDQNQTLKLAEQLTSALDAAHQTGVIHRDIKPSNIFLCASDPIDARLVDFGIARLSDRTALTRTDARPGTPAYMSPEQVRSGQPISSATDVYSLGLVLFECLTGKRMFDSEDVLQTLARIVLDDTPRLSASIPRVEPMLDRLTYRMMARDPSARPTAAQVLEYLTEQSTDDDNGPLLGLAERPLVSVVAARPPGSLGRSYDGSDATVANPKIVQSELRASLSRLSVESDVLSDGSILGVLLPQDSAKQLAARAARCAQILRDALPGFSCAIATGRPAQDDSMSKIIERATASREIRAGEILVDEATAALLGDRYTIEGGKLAGEISSSLRPFELLGRASPFVGRDRELAYLDDVLDEVIGESRSRAVLIAGPSGIGKSRLLEEFLPRIGSRAIVARAAADPTGGDSYSLIVSASLRLLSLGPDTSPEQRRARLRQNWQPNGPDDEKARAVLESLIAPAASRSREQPSGIEAARRGDLQRAAWVSWLRSNLETHPLILAVEDLHWADAASIQLFGLALRNLDNQPLLIVATTRREATQQAEVAWQGPACDELWLGSLRGQAIHTLASQALGDRASPELITELRTRCDGNPFFLEELIRCVDSDDGDALPESVSATIQARTAALPGPARRVLRAGSVFGMSFPSGGLAAIARLSESELVTWLDLLNRRELLRTTPDQKPLDCGFRHATVRETMYSAMAESDREQAHRAAAQWLEQQGWCDAAVLAEHYYRGRNEARAALHFRASAQAALRGNDLDTVVALCQRGLASQCAPQVRGELLLALGEAMYWRGQDGSAVLDEALTLLPVTQANWHLAARLRAYAAAVAGDLAEVEAHAARVVSAQPPADSPAHPTWQIAVAACAEILCHHGDLDATRRLAARLDAPRTPGEIAARQSLAAMDAFIRGDLMNLRAALQRAITSYREDDNIRGAVAAMINLGAMHLMIGCYEEALGVAETSLSEAEKYGVEIYYPVSVLTRAEARIRTDQVAAGILELQTLIASGLGGVYLGQAHELTAIGHYLTGELDAAEAAARAAIAILEAFPRLHGTGLGVLALILAGQERFEEAELLSSRGMSLTAHQDNPERDILLFTARVEALRGMGRTGEANDTACAGRSRVLARAHMISDEQIRQSFLERVWENSQIIQMCPG